MERQRYLREACHGDLELHERILKLLRSYDVAGSFLESRASALAAGGAAPDPDPTTRSGGTAAPPARLEEMTSASFLEFRGILEFASIGDKEADVISRTITGR